MSSKDINSYDAIKSSQFSYKIYGALPPSDTKRRKIYYSFLIPIHSILTIYFFFGFYHDMFVQNIEKATEATSSSLVLTNILVRSLIFYNNRKKIQQSYLMLAELDKLVRNENEKRILAKIIKKCRILEIVVHGIVGLMIVAKIIGIFINFTSDRVPLFPIWVPYDWSTTTWIYVVTMLYQFIAIEFQIIGYFANQLFGPTSICMVIAHVRILRIRLLAIGYDRTKSLTDNHKELIDCAKSFNIIYRIFQIYGKVIKLQMLTQFGLSAVVLAMTIVLSTYFSSSFAATMYTGLYVVNTIVSELLLTCWYGENLKYETNEFTNAYYGMNWMDQTQKFKKDLIMLMQRSQLCFSMVSGFMQIDLRSFMAILRFAYSASLILRNMKVRDYI